MINKSLTKYFFLCVTFLLAGIIFLLPIFSLDYTTSGQAFYDEGTYQDLENGLFKLYKQFGVMQDGEEIEIKKSELEVLDGEEYVSTASLSGISTFSAQDEAVSLSSLKESYEVTESEDEYFVKENDQTNRVIVEYDGDLKPYNTTYYAEGLGYHIYQYETEEETVDAYNYYSSLPYVESVSYDNVVTASDFETITNTETQSGYLSWGATVTGVDDYMAYLNYIYDDSELESVYVVVFDSGVNTDHEILKDRIDYKHSKDFTGTGSTAFGAYEFEDDNGHGSHTAGIIADQTKDNVKIISLKVLKANGKGSSTNIILAMEYIRNLKDEKYMSQRGEEALDIRVCNMSLGLENENKTEVSNPTLEGLVEDLYDEGTMIVVSAGNSGKSTKTSSPANTQKAVVVSALNEDLSLAGYSNYGETVDFCAPGTLIKSSYKEYINEEGVLTDYKLESGTSMAAPHVTASIALLLSSPRYCVYTNAQLLDELSYYALDLGSAGKDIYYGYGCVDLSKFGITTQGEVEFSVAEINHTDEFSLELSYSNNSDCTIYYTLDESTPSVSSAVYETPITISKTTKVTAVAYLNKSSNDSIVKSEISSKTYYFDNIDLESSFETRETLWGVTIQSYNGELTTLNIQSTMNNRSVVAIGNNAFSNSYVESVSLPSKCVSLGNYAFYNARNLREINCENVKSVGSYCFANCINLKELSLPNASQISVGAFNNTKMSTLILGGGVRYFGEMMNFEVETLECYTGGNFDDIYREYAKNIVSVNMSATLTSNATRIIAREGENPTLTFEVVGKYSSGCSYGLSEYSQEECEKYIDLSVDNSQFETNHKRFVTVTFKNLDVGEYVFQFASNDTFGNQTEVISVTVLILSADTQTYSLRIEGEDYVAYIDGQKAENGFTLYEGVDDYNLKLEAIKGSEIQNIQINNEEVLENDLTLTAIDGDVVINCVVKEIEEFNFEFVYDESASVTINGEVAESNEIISREEDVMVKVNVAEGYKITEVKVNGEDISLNADNTFILENVLEDFVIEVKTSVIVNYIFINYGAGGTVGANSMEEIAYGDDRTIEIFPEDNFEIDTVLVNGEVVEVENNTITLQNVVEDMYVIISFKELKGGLTTGEWTVLIVFLVFVIIALVWALAEIIYRNKLKKKYNYRKNISNHF